MGLALPTPWLAGGLVGTVGDEADWEPTGLAEPILELFTPATGAFFARTTGDLSRSEDGGATWSMVMLPTAEPDPRAWTVTVDPTDHTVLYASGAGGLYKTIDDAASWMLVLPTQRYVRGRRRQLGQSRPGVRGPGSSIRHLVGFLVPAQPRWRRQLGAARGAPQHPVRVGRANPVSASDRTESGVPRGQLPSRAGLRGFSATQHRPGRHLGASVRRNDPQCR